MIYKTLFCSILVVSAISVNAQWTNTTVTEHSGSAQLNNSQPKYILNTTGGGVFGLVEWHINGSRQAYLGRGQSGKFLIHNASSGQEHVVIDGNGNVGINGPSFNHKLTVNGNSFLSGADNNGSNATLKIVDGGADTMLFDANEIDVIGSTFHLNFNSSTNVSIARGGGDVGIGTNQPSEKLDVRGNGIFTGLNPSLRLNRTSFFPTGIYWSTNGTNDAYILKSTSSLLINNSFPVDGDNDILITSDGKVGINDDDPDGFQLSAVGNIRFEGPESNGTTGTLHINDGGSDNMILDANEIDVTESTFHINNNSNSNLSLVYGGGNVGIGTATPSQKLHVNGDATVAGFIAQPSDMRLKKDIDPLENALFKILQLNSKIYTYRTEEFSEINLPKGRHAGILAQEVEQIIPEIVIQEALTDDGGRHYKGIDYERLIPYLVEAIKEQQLQIEALQSELEKMK